MGRKALGSSNLPLSVLPGAVSAAGPIGPNPRRLRLSTSAFESVEEPLRTIEPAPDGVRSLPHSTGCAVWLVPFAGKTWTVLMFTISRSP